jgi:hypothetical protein
LLSDYVVQLSDSPTFYLLEMLDKREGLVEPVEQIAPPLIVGRSSESDGVVFKTIPVDQQQEHIWSLDAPRQGQRPEAGHSADDRFRIGKRRPKLLAHAGPNR